MRVRARARARARVRVVRANVQLEALGTAHAYVEDGADLVRVRGRVRARVVSVSG